MIFNRDFVTHENHCRIASHDKKSLLMVTLALFFLSLKLKPLKIQTTPCQWDKHFYGWYMVLGATASSAWIWVILSVWYKTKVVSQNVGQLQSDGANSNQWTINQSTCVFFGGVGYIYLHDTLCHTAVAISHQQWQIWPRLKHICLGHSWHNNWG